MNWGRHTLEKTNQRLFDAKEIINRYGKTFIATCLGVSVGRIEKILQSKCKLSQDMYDKIKSIDRTERT